MNQKPNYSVLFKSMNEFKEDKSNEEIYKIIELGNEITVQTDYLKQFCSEESEHEFIGYTRT